MTFTANESDGSSLTKQAKGSPSQHADLFYANFRSMDLDRPNIIDLSKPHVVSTVAQGIAAMGWDVEVYQDDLEGEIDCDIYAQKGAGKIAVNICFNPIDMDHIKHKQAAYKAAGVRGLWLLKPCEGATCSLSEKIGYNSNDIPIFYIMQNTGMTLIHGVQYFNDGWGGHEVGFYEVPLDPFFFAYFLFKRNIQFKPQYDNDVFLHCSIQERTCFKCQAEINTVQKIIYTRRIYGEFVNEDYYQSSDIRDVPASEIELINRTFSNKHGFSPVKPMFSKFMQASYMANSCCHCGVIMGAFFEEADLHSPVVFTSMTASTLSPKECFGQEEMDIGMGAWVLCNNSEEATTIVSDLLDLGVVDFDENAYYPTWFSLIALPDGDDYGEED